MLHSSINLAYKIAKNLYYIGYALLLQPKFLLKRSRVPLSSRIGKSVCIYGTKMGGYCYIGPGCVLNNVQIGSYSSLAPYVQIGGMEHSWWWGSTSTRLSSTCVDNLITILEEDIWVGANAVIKQGVRIGRGTIVGACSLVLKDIPPYSIVGGVPARFLKVRFPENIISQIEATGFWKHPPRIAKRLLHEIDYPDDKLLNIRRKDPSI